MSIQLEQAKQTAKKIARRTLWITLAGLLVASLGYYVYRTWEVSDGTRVGTLFKISRKGLVFKTFEGQLHLAGSAMMSPQSTWDFSVKDDATYQQIQLFEGKPVKCHYKELINPFPWQGDTKYLVFRVEAP
jgi:hypothetical protein